jgi:hypothetical protein
VITELEAKHLFEGLGGHCCDIISRIAVALDKTSDVANGAELGGDVDDDGANRWFLLKHREMITDDLVVEASDEDRLITANAQLADDCRPNGLLEDIITKAVAQTKAPRRSR